MTGIVVGVILAAAGIYLWVSAFRARREWVDHASQVRAMREWESQRKRSPYNQVAPSPPPVTSPYAAPAQTNPPALPPAPGTARTLWGGILVVAGVIVVVAELAIGVG